MFVSKHSGLKLIAAGAIAILAFLGFSFESRKAFGTQVASAAQCSDDVSEAQGDDTSVFVSCGAFLE
jgi:hypothetical protein